MPTSVETLRCLSEFVLATNILIGTDYPFIIDKGIEQSLELLANCNIDFNRLTYLPFQNLRDDLNPCKVTSGYKGSRGSIMLMGVLKTNCNELTC